MIDTETASAFRTAWRLYVQRPTV